MKLSTRTRYGLRALVELAMNRAWVGSGTNALSLSIVSANQEIPEPYLRQLFVRLKDRGLVISRRGKSGGYLLSKPPGEMNVLDIIDALGESLELVFCVADPNKCPRVEKCPTHALWRQLSGGLERSLGRMSLKQLADECNRD